MGIYSHSKLSAFEQCPLKFKLRYIDKIIPESEKTIESHLGSVVHSVLEILHTKAKKGKILSVEEVIKHYFKKWEECYKPEIVIVRKDTTAEDYFNKGIKFLTDYYRKNHPFEENTLAVEKKIKIELGEHSIVGFIDRLVHNAEKDEYEIHDYKTANSMPLREAVENDRQLALYSLAIKEIFGQEKKVCLVWHYLAHNQKIRSRRTDEQLEKLKKEVLELIEKIESTDNFHPYISKLCDWCEYKSMCYAWTKNHKQKELDIW
ncbi:MAG: PD-(D/E)XK nuclease family protein [archaeon]